MNLEKGVTNTMHSIKQFFKREDVQSVLIAALQAILSIVIEQKVISKFQKSELKAELA